MRGAGSVLAFTHIHTPKRVLSLVYVQYPSLAAASVNQGTGRLLHRDGQRRAEIGREGGASGQVADARGGGTSKRAGLRIL